MVHWMSNSHSVMLLLAFAAAGVLLVFFILAFNLTATRVYKPLLPLNDSWSLMKSSSNLCQRCMGLHQTSYLFTFFKFYFLAQLGFWDWDLLLYWTECLLEDMATSFYSHFISGHGPLLESSLLLAATPLASPTSLVAELFDQSSSSHRDSSFCLTWSSFTLW